MFTSSSHEHCYRKSALPFPSNLFFGIHQTFSFHFIFYFLNCLLEKFLLSVFILLIKNLKELFYISGVDVVLCNAMYNPYCYCPCVMSLYIYAGLLFVMVFIGQCMSCMIALFRLGYAVIIIHSSIPIYLFQLFCLLMVIQFTTHVYTNIRNDLIIFHYSGPIRIYLIHDNSSNVA